MHHRHVARNHHLAYSLYAKAPCSYCILFLRNCTIRKCGFLCLKPKPFHTRTAPIYFFPTHALGRPPQPSFPSTSTWNFSLQELEGSVITALVFLFLFSVLRKEVERQHPTEVQHFRLLQEVEPLLCKCHVTDSHLTEKPVP